MNYEASLLPDNITAGKEEKKKENYILGIPAHAEKLLPEWVGMAETLDYIPQDSIILVDEAYLSYHSRESPKAQNNWNKKMQIYRQHEVFSLIFTEF